MVFLWDSYRMLVNFTIYYMTGTEQEGKKSMVAAGNHNKRSVFIYSMNM